MNRYRLNPKMLAIYEEYLNNGFFSKYWDTTGNNVSAKARLIQDIRLHYNISLQDANHLCELYRFEMENPKTVIPREKTYAIEFNGCGITGFISSYPADFETTSTILNNTIKNLANLSHFQVSTVIGDYTKPVYFVTKEMWTAPFALKVVEYSN